MPTRNVETVKPVKRALYFADPMCSWCWGFAPVLERIRALFGKDVGIRPVLGGLRAGTTRAMTERDKDYVRHHWQAVHAETGQPFSFAFFDLDGFVYDTEPACRAVVTLRSLSPSDALDYLEAVQRAFYVGNRDVTQGEVLADIANDFGVEREVFEALFSHPEIVHATQADFATARAAGVGGFPTVVLQSGHDFALLTAGYRGFEELQPLIQAWLRG
jgi:putative protein-disulfide isomerase